MVPTVQRHLDTVSLGFDGGNAVDQQSQGIKGAMKSYVGRLLNLYFLCMCDLYAYIVCSINEICFVG